MILPFYNAGATIERAIKSISRQTFEFFECILIDNNSVDKSPSIAENITKTDSRYKLVKEKKQGVVHASNKGCLVANGKYIARMDADDEAYPQRLEKQLDFLEKNNPFHPDILVWGASRISRKRVEMLEKHGAKVKAFIDTNTTRQTGRKIIHYKEIPPPSVAFIVTYITHKDIREKIREFLHKKGYNEGAHFLVAS